MTQQDQKVAKGGTAIQAAGSVSISSGMTPDQMSEIMVGLAKQLSSYQLDAHKVVEERLQQFRQEILDEFAKPGRANAEAFKDPDFQYLLNRAQHAYARTGDKEVGDTLVQMIAERSRCTQRTRMSLSLNQAVETAAVLTVNDFAELGLSFLLTQTKDLRIRSWESFSQYFNQSISPLLDNVSTAPSSYTYLEAQQCVSINRVTTITLDNPLIANYGGLFGDGFTMDEVEQQLGNDEAKLALVQPYLIACMNDPTKLQLKAINEDEAKVLLLGRGLDAAQNLINLFSSKMWRGQTFIDKMTAKIPDFGRLAKLWSETPLCQITLTTLGTVIGHANMHRINPQFRADLSIWIK